MAVVAVGLKDLGIWSYGGENKIKELVGPGWLRYIETDIKEEEWKLVLEDTPIVLGAEVL